MPKRYVKKSKRPEGIRFCPNCDKALTSKNTLREHLAKRHQWHGDTSHFPVFQFDSWDAVRNHENLRVAKRNNCTGVVQPNPYECEHCDYTFPSAKLLVAHCEDAHNLFKCGYCEDIFNSSDERDGHQTGHLTHYCDSCDWVFYTLEALELHKRDRHNLCLNEKITGQAVAPSPSKSVTSVSLCSSTTSYGNANKYNKTINQTMVRPSSSLSSGLNKLTMLTCETCGESFTMKNKLLRHKRACHPCVRFCLQCKMVFQSERNLCQHLQSGALKGGGVLQFDSWEALRKYRDDHSAKSNNDPVGTVQSPAYECDCGDIFASFNERDEHQTRHVTHHCNSCDRVFYTSEALEQHNRDSHDFRQPPPLTCTSHVSMHRSPSTNSGSSVVDDSSMPLLSVCTLYQSSSSDESNTKQSKSGTASEPRMSVEMVPELNEDGSYGVNTTPVVSDERKIPLQAISLSPSKSLSSISLRSSPTSHYNANKPNTAIDESMVRPWSRLSSGINKMGMQFGSLSIGDASFDASLVESRAAEIIQKSKVSFPQPIQALPPVIPQTSQAGVQSVLRQFQQPASATYFRQTDAPCFHILTPLSAIQYYAVDVFGRQIGQKLPAQAPHLSGFGCGDYGYDGQRGFYDSHAQSPESSGSHSVLRHSNLKGLPTSHQLPSASVSVPPSSSSQSIQLPPPQVLGTSQPSAAQGPQQSHPPHVMPYYYPYPQNHQYYRSLYNSGYGVPQTFFKYPTMFQPPPAQGTGAGKQRNVQQDHYGRSLYGSQHHAPGVGSLGGEHKHPHLYGNQGIQGFMGLGQASNASSGPTLGQRTGGASPEAAYKPYL